MKKDFIPETGLTVVIPAYGPVNVVTRSVYSAVSAYRGKNSKYKLEVLIYADDVEYQQEHDGASQYDYFLSDEFKKLIEFPELTEIKVIHNLEKYGQHIYQGGARLEGLNNSKYKLVCLQDCDDVFAPSFIVQALDIYNKEAPKCPIYRIGGAHLSFDENGYQKNVGNSIWVQSYAWNSDFVKHFCFTMNSVYKNPINRRQGEDYLMCQQFCYAFDHNRATPEDVQNNKCWTEDGSPIKWQEIIIQDSRDTLPHSFWYPNHDSLSRQDPFYGQHLAGSTMSSSNTIIEFMQEFNKKYGIEAQEDEQMKHRILNMSIYSWFNLADFLKTVAVSHQMHKLDSKNPAYIPKEEDWRMLRDNCDKLKMHLLKYWKELQYADIEDELYRVRHMSDARVCNVWFGSFYDYMEKPVKFFGMSYKEMMDYATKLEFDNGACNCTSSQQYKAFIKRHKGGNIK